MKRSLAGSASILCAASAQAICAADFTLLHETKKGYTGKPLLGGFRLTGLVGSSRTADDQAAEYENKSE
jgi:hypothetical protein